MFIPPGFHSNDLMTPLGRMVYYTNRGEPWLADESDSREPLVFLHGFGGGSSAYEWSKVYPAFAADYRILAPDLIGWGRSNHPARRYTVENYLTIITEFISQTCDRPVTVIASALTAAFTLRLATDRPDLFKSLIVTTAAGLADFEQDYRHSGFAQFAQSVDFPFANQLLYNTGVANSLGIRSFLERRQFARPERVSPEIVEAYLKSARQQNAEYAALSFVRGDLCFDLAQYMPRLATPTAMIWGQGGGDFTEPELGRRLAELNPEAVRIFYQLNDVGYTPQLELPGVTVGLIRKFLPMLAQAADS